MDNYITQKITNDFVILHISKDVTDEEIDECIRKGLPTAMQTKRGWCCAIGGYDKDERELYQIPEVTDLCKRLCDRGLIAILHPSTLVTQDELPEISKFFGALEVWSLATGYLNSNGDLHMDQPKINAFLAALDKANVTAYSTAFPTTTDGQHRTKLR